MITVQQYPGGCGGTLGLGEARFNFSPEFTV